MKIVIRMETAKELEAAQFFTVRDESQLILNTLVTMLLTTILIKIAPTTYS